MASSCCIMLDQQKQHTKSTKDINIHACHVYNYTIKNLHLEKLGKLTNKHWLNKLLPQNYPKTKKYIVLILAEGLKLK